ncbi:MAG: putative DNA binding domain-containing protein [Eubacteriales bacterium]|nr:putative DNA binding domain-containing protein [Eubacteriales bacterium]
MTSNEILDLLKYGERLTLECKKAEGGLPNALWETYSSFANTSGGVILLGVEEHLKETELEKRFTFCNLSNPEKMIKSFWDTVNSKKVSANLLLDENVGICQIAGCNIIWIEVPQADYRYRPVYLNENPLKGSYKRNHEGDYHCTEAEVKAMLRDASDFGIDGSLLEGFTMDDIDENTLKTYRIEYELHNPEHVWNGSEDKDFLRNLGGYTVNRITKQEGLTVAGLLMFGKGLAVRERFDNIRMDYIDQTNLIGESRWSDRLTYDGSWENNLYNFVKRVLPKLVSNIKRPFQLQGMIRQDDTAVHKAVREAVINMIIHADYYGTGILKVVKQDNGFFFSNPGNLKLPVQAIYEGGHSIARNPKIQNMFRMIGLGDNIGSGFPAILKAWGEEKWRQPDLYDDQELHQVELKLWTISLMPTECTEFLNNKFGINYYHLSSKEQIILATAYLEGKVSNSRLQTVLGEHSAEVGKYLYHLVEKEMLIPERKGRWTTYYINNEYIIQPEQMTIQDMPVRETVLNETDQKIYNYVRANGMITSQQVVEITGISTLQGASVALNRMIKKGLLLKRRKGRHIYYQLLE